jgi:drug/metabolite transporter (DMT)-like permease
MLGAVGCGALYNVLARPFLHRYPARAFTAWAMLAGAAALGLASLAGGFRLPVSAPAWGAALFLGIAGGALAFLLWSWALERTTPTRVAVSVTVNPLVPLALAPALLGEPTSPRLALGIAAVLGGIALSCLGPEAAGKPRVRPLSSPQIPHPEETSPCPTTRSVP